MAEAVVGLAASIATLSKIIQYSSRIILRARNVPKEIADLSQEISQLSVELEILHELQNVSLPASTAGVEHAWTMQRESVLRAQSRVVAVHKALTVMEAKSKSVKGKVQWLIMSREETSYLLQNLQQIRMALTSAMSMSSHLLQLAFHAEEMRAITDLGVEYTRTLKAMEQDTTRSTSSTLQGQFNQQGSVIPTGTLFRDCSSAQTTINLPLLGRLMSTVTTFKHHSGIFTYAFSLLLQLPFSRVLIADVFVRSWSLSWLNFRILRDSTLAVVKLVEEDSDFMFACKRGDVNTMEKMLLQGEATPNEITLSHRTPIWDAIESGETQAVELLLRYGADINSHFGMWQTSPLVISIRRRNVEMVRLLLAHGACDQHVTALGWTPLFYLWSLSSSNLFNKPAGSVIEILSPRPGFNLSHSQIVDTRGYGLIHMAAIRGTAADIHALVNSGVNPFLKTKESQWQASQFAVEAGNIETFVALLSYYPSDGIHSTDTQGWGFLHISAITGHGHVSQRLLELGINLHALTSANTTSAPDGLEYLEREMQGRQWSALQLAELHSDERKAVFLEAVSCVSRSRILQSADDSELDQDAEVWEDAQSYMT